MDEERKVPSPAEMIGALLGQVESGPVGKAIEVLQKQLDAVFHHIQVQTTKIVHSLGSTRIDVVHSKLVTGMLVQTLIDKGVFSKEEFDKLYDERVVKAMDEYVMGIKTAMEQKQEEAEPPQEEDAEVIPMPIPAASKEE